jgi:prophage regulatory protein
MLIDFNELRRLVGKSRSTIWRWEQNGQFPRRARTGPNSVAWVREEVLAWIAAKLDERVDDCHDDVPAWAQEPRDEPHDQDESRTPKHRAERKVRGRGRRPLPSGSETVSGRWRRRRPRRTPDEAARRPNDDAR